MRIQLLLATALLLAGTSALPARADVVHLRGGRQLVGRVVDDGDPVRLEMPGGTLSLPRTRVERIERAELPSDALELRFEALADGDVAGALALAVETRDAGLPDATGRLLERAEEWAPDDPAVRDAVWRWRVFERRLTPDADAAERLRLTIGKDAHVLRSARWRIAHDVTVEVARERAAALESAWRAFHRLMLDLGLRPEPVDDRLEALLFRNHADWVRATGAPAAALQGLNGLYVGPTGRILLFDPLTAPEAGRANDQIADAVGKLAERAASIDQQQEQLVGIRRQVEEYRPTPADRKGAEMRRDKLAEIDEILAELDDQRTALGADAAEVDAYRVRVRGFWSEETVSATMHEACHQVGFATGVLHAEHPLWLNEGLATLFEAGSREALDPTSKTSARLRDARALRDADRGGDLRRLVTGVAFAQKPTAEAYAEAWSLTSFLVHRHPEGLARILRTRPRTDASVAPAQRDLRAFEEAFGDLDEIERAWRRFVERL